LIAVFKTQRVCTFWWNMPQMEVWKNIFKIIGQCSQRFTREFYCRLWRRWSTCTSRGYAIEIWSLKTSYWMRTLVFASVILEKPKCLVISIEINYKTIFHHLQGSFQSWAHPEVGIKRISTVLKTARNKVWRWACKAPMPCPQMMVRNSCKKCSFKTIMKYRLIIWMKE